MSECMHSQYACNFPACTHEECRMNQAFGGEHALILGLVSEAWYGGGNQLDQPGGRALGCSDQALRAALKAALQNLAHLCPQSHEPADWRTSARQSHTCHELQDATPAQDYKSRWLVAPSLQKDENGCAPLVLKWV